MELLDHYLRTLRIFLPKDHRDDIVRELSEEIRPQVDEKEATLGRALDVSEQAGCASWGGPGRRLGDVAPEPPILRDRGRSHTMIERSRRSGDKRHPPNHGHSVAHDRVQSS